MRKRGAFRPTKDKPNFVEDFICHHTSFVGKEFDPFRKYKQAERRKTVPYKIFQCRSDEVPAKLCNETASYPFIFINDLRAYSNAYIIGGVRKRGAFRPTKDKPAFVEGFICHHASFVGKGLDPFRKYKQAERRKTVPYNSHLPCIAKRAGET